MLLLFPISLFHLFITSFIDALYVSLFVIVYTYAYSTQSPNMALFSCLLRTLGIVTHLLAQYIQLLTSDSSCLISCHSRSQPRSSVLHLYINVPRNRLWAPASRHVTNIISYYNVQFNSNFPQTQQLQLQVMVWRYAGLADVQGALDAGRQRRTLSGRL